jgi:hypothetical protein
MSLDARCRRSKLMQQHLARAQNRTKPLGQLRQFQLPWPRGCALVFVWKRAHTALKGLGTALPGLLMSSEHVLGFGLALGI